MSLRHRILGAIGLTVVGFSTVTALTTPAGAETPPLPDTVANLTSGSPAPAPSEPIVWYDGSVTTMVTFRCIGNAEVPESQQTNFWLDCLEDKGTMGFIISSSDTYGFNSLRVIDGVSFAETMAFGNQVTHRGALSTAPAMSPFDVKIRPNLLVCASTLHQPTNLFPMYRDVLCAPNQLAPGMSITTLTIKRFENSLEGNVFVDFIGSIDTRVKNYPVLTTDTTIPSIMVTESGGSFTSWQQPVYDPTAPLQGDVAVGTPLSTDPSVVNPIVIGVPACLAATDGVVGNPDWAKPVGNPALIDEVYKDIPATTCTGV